MSEIKILKKEQKLFRSDSISSLFSVPLKSRLSIHKQLFQQQSLNTDSVYKPTKIPTMAGNNQKEKLEQVNTKNINKIKTNKAKDLLCMLHLRSISHTYKENENTKMDSTQSKPDLAKFNLSKKELLKMDMLDRFEVKQWLDDELSNFLNEFRNVLSEDSAPINDRSFLKTNEVSIKTYFHLISYAKFLLKECEISSSMILKHAHLFDFSEIIQGNGYRMVVRNYDSSCRHLLMMIIKLNEKRTGLFFRMGLHSKNIKFNNDLKELQAWVCCFFMFAK